MNGRLFRCECVIASISPLVVKVSDNLNVIQFYVLSIKQPSFLMVCHHDGSVNNETDKLSPRIKVSSIPTDKTQQVILQK